MKRAIPARLFAHPSQWRLACAMVLLLAALLLPDINLSRRTFDYLITFDITQSMNVEDVELDGQRVRRLVQARAAVRDVLRHLPCGSLIGWSVFSGYRSFVLLEPIEVCANYEVLLSSLDKIGDPMRWANASNIGKGVYWAMKNAKTLAPAKLVFMTDGQEAPPVEADAMVAAPTEPGDVDGILIGVGGGLPSRIPKTDAHGFITGYWTHDELDKATSGAAGNGHEELSELREQYLRLLAQHNGVSYEPLRSASSLTGLLMQSKYSLRKATPTNVRWVPATLALLLLLWGYVPGIRLRQTGRRQESTGAVAMP